MKKIIKLTLLVLILCTLVLLFTQCSEKTSAPDSSGVTDLQTKIPAQNEQPESFAVQQLEEFYGEASEKNFYLIFDGSGSMGDKECRGDFVNRIEAAKWAVKEFVKQVVPADVSLGLYAFDDSGAKQRVPLGRDNRDLILQEVDSLSYGRGTPLSDSITFAVDILKAHQERKLGYVFRIVVITDGQADVDKGVRAAREAEIPIITIGFCLPDEHPLKDPNYSLTYRGVENPSQLFKALQETQAELPEYDTD